MIGVSGRRFSYDTVQPTVIRSAHQSAVMIESGRCQLLPYRVSATKSDALRMRGETSVTSCRLSAERSPNFASWHFAAYSLVCAESFSAVVMSFSNFAPFLCGDLRCQRRSIAALILRIHWSSSCASLCS